MATVLMIRDPGVSFADLPFHAVILRARTRHFLLEAEFQVEVGRGVTL